MKSNLMASSSSSEENYWPGYVDALTTMTMVLTFIMMILGVVVFSMSQNMSKAIITAVAKAAKIDVPTTGGIEAVRDRIVAALEAAAQREAAAKAQLQAAQAAQGSASPASSGSPASAIAMTAPSPSPATAPNAAPAIASSPEEKRITSAAAPPAPAAPAPTVRKDGPVLTIAFQRLVVDLDEPARAAFKAAIETMPALLSSQEIEVKGYTNPGAPGVSEARRLAYYRAMSVRTRLIERGVAPTHIRVRIEDGTADDAELVRVFVRS